MWTRALLKANAKGCLKNYYVIGIIAGVIASVISSVISQLLTTLAAISSGTTFIGSLLAFAVVIFITGPLNIGLNRFFLDARFGEPELGKTFWAFGGGRYGNVMGISALMYIKIALWSLLLYFPGIYKTYEYALIPYILAENPNISSKRAFEISKRTMDGEKFNLFLLQLSFIGWFLLGVLCFGIGTFFVRPYYYATMAEFYCCMREKALANGYAYPEELYGGFAPKANAMPNVNPDVFGGFGSQNINQSGSTDGYYQNNTDSMGGYNQTQGGFNQYNGVKDGHFDEKEPMNNEAEMPEMSGLNDTDDSPQTGKVNLSKESNRHDDDEQ
ncbi:MAG: DUF975 family protein [Oscillospiraceae bacterium]|nr:DUF975 family protein [Oscillospiraceae bacterium]